MVKLHNVCLGALLLALGQLPCTLSEKLNTIVTTVLRESLETNVVVAPQPLMESVWELYMGARRRTEDEIGAIINSENISKSKVFDMYSKWHKNYTKPDGVLCKMGQWQIVPKKVKILKSFRLQMDEVFNNAADATDFRESLDTMLKLDSWLANCTRTKLKGFNEKGQRDNKILALSAAYFEAEWKYPTESLQKRSFYVQQDDDSIEIEIDAMSQFGKFNFDYVPQLNADALQIPYANSNVSMLILLPRKKNGIEKVLRKFHKIDIDDILSEPTEVELEIFIPQLKGRYKLALREEFESLGIKALFTNANLSAMTDYKKNLRVSEFVQTVVFRTNEIQNLTLIVPDMETQSDINMRNQVHIDRPFLFLIKDSEHIYLAGHIGNPNA